MKIEDLADMEHEDVELVPDILPVDARLSLRGEVSRLIALLERAATVTPDKEIIPGTSFALLETVAKSKNRSAFARITATDGDQSVSVMSDGIEVIMAGAVLLPPKKILKALKLAPSAMARLDVVGVTATLNSGRARWSFSLPVGNALPPLPDVDSIPLTTLDRAELLKPLLVARRAADDRLARTSMLQLLVRDGFITGTDGNRVHRAFVPGLLSDVETTIRLKTVDEMIKALQATEEDSVAFGSNERHTVLRLGPDVLIGQRILLPYPNIDKVITEAGLKNQSSLAVDRDELLGVVKRVRVNADPERTAIFLGIVPTDDAFVLVVRARDRNGNAAQEVLDVSWTGARKARELAVNHKHLVDLLALYPDDHIIFKIGDDTKAARMPLFVEDNVLGFAGLIQQMTTQGL